MASRPRKKARGTEYWYLPAGVQDLNIQGLEKLEKTLQYWLKKAPRQPPTQVVLDLTWEAQTLLSDCRKMRARLIAERDGSVKTKKALTKDKLRDAARKVPRGTKSKKR